MVQMRTPAALAQVISTACIQQEAGQEYGGIAKAIKAEFVDAVAAATAASTRGDVVAKKLSSLIDIVISVLYAEGARRYPEASEEVVICAVGGYGRGRLAPYSDIDLLFLHKFSNENKIKPFLDYILYPLWDAGFAVGQGVHTPKSAISFANSDFVGRTAYLDARFLTGDRTQFEDFQSRFDKMRSRSQKAFVRAKLEEQQERHDASLESQFLSEPDLKDGKGGLRDLQTIRWLYRYAYGEQIDAKNASVQILDKADIRAFNKAERFLWSVRVQLHDLRGRANETIGFEVQPELAERLGYQARSGALPAERLMKHYFVNATEVGRLTRLFSAKFEEDQGLSRPRLPRKLPSALASDEQGNPYNIVLTHGRLDFAGPIHPQKAAHDFLWLFYAFALRPEFDFSPSALANINQHTSSITRKEREDARLNQRFLACLLEAKQPIKLLRVMGEAGFLAKFFPFLGPLTGQVEYGLYRRYTLDEQIYQMLGVLNEVRNGQASDEHPILAQVLENTPHIEYFYLLLLIYEARHGMTDQSDRAVEKLTRRFLKRMGAISDISDKIVNVVLQPTLMVDYAQRRNVSSKLAIKQFAEMVGDSETLELYLALSVCHLRVINESSWDNWRKSQLTDLYLAAKACLLNGEAGLERWRDEQISKIREHTVSALKRWSGSEIDALFARTPDDLILNVGPEHMVRYAHLAKSAAQQPAAVDATLVNGFLETIIYAQDRPGLLADLAGAVARQGGGVRTLRAFTASDGQALDFMTIAPPAGASFEEREQIAAMHSALLSAARAAPKSPYRFAARVGDRRKIFQVDAKVRLDHETSAECVVVEAEGRDRPGLLYKLAYGLADIGVQIRSAYIATYGERAVDTFYLQDAPGYKIIDTRRLQSIQNRLLNILMADD